MTTTRYSNKIHHCWIAILLALFVAEAVAGDVHPAAALVMQTTEKMQSQLRAERETLKQDNARVGQLVETIILPHVNFEDISASVLGKYWRTANADQRQRFREAFKSLLLRTYANALVDNMDKKIDFEPVRAQDNATDVTVRSSIPQGSEFPLPINYSLELVDNEWKVYDIEIDGLSLVKNYRTTFAKEIKRSGLEALIKVLAERSKDANS